MTLLQICASGYLHFCPGCQKIHILPAAHNNPHLSANNWSFNNNFAQPTFNPSFRHNWTYGHEKLELVCHYFITDGILHFCGDCTHDMAGKSVPLPEIPEKYADFY